MEGMQEQPGGATTTTMNVKNYAAKFPDKFVRLTKALRLNTRANAGAVATAQRFVNMVGPSSALDSPLAL